MNIAVCAMPSAKLHLSPTNFSQTTEPTTEVVRPPAEIQAKFINKYRLTTPLAMKFGAFSTFCVLKTGVCFGHDTGDMERDSAINMPIWRK